jgi:hypothetical protein
MVKKNPNKTDFERLIRSAMFEHDITITDIAAKADVKGDGSPTVTSYIHLILRSPENRHVVQKQRIAKYTGVKWEPSE